jgi:hypothetical protein
MQRKAKRPKMRYSFGPEMVSKTVTQEQAEEEVYTF